MQAPRVCGWLRRGNDGPSAGDWPWSLGWESWDWCDACEKLGLWKVFFSIIYDHQLGMRFSEDPAPGSEEGLWVSTVDDLEDCAVMLRSCHLISPRYICNYNTMIGCDV